MSHVTPNPDFWKKMDQLLASSEMIIDRPKGSHHPKWPEIIYPLDYGYLKDTTASDGECIDVWLGSDPERKLTAMFVTVDSVNRDTEIKLLVGCTEAEILMIDHFFNDYDTIKALLIYREEPK